MPFKSLRQAYWLYKNKPTVFRQIAGVYGVPKGWHDYKKERENTQNVQKSWKGILKNKGPKTKRQVITQQRKRGDLVRNTNKLYGNYVLTKKPKWFGALSSLNDLRNGYRIMARANIDETITHTEKIKFILYVNAHIIQRDSPPKYGLVVKAELHIRAFLESGKTVEISPVEQYKSINDFVEIYNKPSHKYKNIEAEIIYRTRNTEGTDLDISFEDLLSLKYESSGDYFYHYDVNDKNRVILNNYSHEVFKRLKGIQLKEVKMCEIVKMYISERPCKERTDNIADWCYECRQGYIYKL